MKKIIALILLLIVVCASAVWYYQWPQGLREGLLGAFKLIWGVVLPIISNWFILLLLAILVIVSIIKLF